MFWYVCCWPPLPNTFLHSPLVEAELIGWLTHAHGHGRFPAWAFCLWPADPWRRASWRYPLFPAADMWFVLPGADGWPVETVRYEGMRMAAQDFELLKLVERTLSPEAAAGRIEQAMQHILTCAVARGLCRCRQCATGARRRTLFVWRPKITRRRAGSCSPHSGTGRRRVVPRFSRCVRCCVAQHTSRQIPTRQLRIESDILWLVYYMTLSLRGVRHTSGREPEEYHDHAVCLCRHIMIHMWPVASGGSPTSSAQPMPSSGRTCDSLRAASEDRLRVALRCG